MVDPRVISIDIETYGICRYGHTGNPLPTQKETKRNGRFHPRKCLYLDGPRGLDPNDLIQTVAITLPEFDPRCQRSRPKKDTVPPEAKVETTRTTPRRTTAGPVAPSTVPKSDSTTSAERPSPTPSSSTTATSYPVASSASSLSSSWSTSSRSSSMASGWDLDSLTRLQNGSTMVFRMSHRAERHRLLKWLQHADTLIGQNLPFDLQVMRTYCPLLRSALNGTRHLLIDLTTLNYLENEIRPEKDLKSLSMLLRTAAYSHTPGDRYDNASDPALHYYNGMDTHATLANVATLARRIARDYSHTDKLSPFCIQFYSDSLWSTIRMSEAGLPMNRASLSHFERSLVRRCQIATAIAQLRFNVRLEGKDSSKDKLAFMERVVTHIQLHYDPDILNHPLFQLTDTRHDISINDVNRSLFEHIISPTTPLDREFLLGLRLLGIHMKAQKLISSYTYPLLRHTRKDPSNQTSILIPVGIKSLCHRSHSPSSETSSTSTTPTPTDASTGLPSSTSRQRRKRTPSQWLKRHAARELRRVSHAARRKAATPKKQLVTYQPTPTPIRLAWEPPPQRTDICICYPSWFVTPSYTKDSGGDSGGTIQGRITCKAPAAQTFPDEIKHHICSRWRDGSIVWFDLSQIELRVAAIMSGDAELLAAYCSPHPTDLHTTCARQVFGERCTEDPDFKSKYRDPAKHFRFGHLYRAGPAKLQMTVLRKSNIIVPLSFCEKVVRNRPFSQPGLWAWQNELIATAKRDGYIYLPFTGQSRMFMGGEKYDISEIVNMPIQTTAGNVMLRIHAYCHHHGPPLNDRNPSHYQILNVYDAIVFDCRDSAATVAATDLVRTAVETESHDGYWSNLTLHYGRFVPLAYERVIAA